MSLELYGTLGESSSDIEHHGVKGQKWGVRRYVDPSGHLTAEGRVKAAKNYQRYKDSPGYINKVNRYKKKGMSEEEAVFRAGRSMRRTRMAEVLSFGLPAVGVTQLRDAHNRATGKKKLTLKASTTRRLTHK